MIVFNRGGLVNMLQESLNQRGVTVLNYTDNKILVLSFYNEDRYHDFKNGSLCHLGQGVYNANEPLELNKIEDNILIVVQKDGQTIKKYKYTTIFTSPLEFKDGTNKKRSLTIRIRKNLHSDKLNFIDNANNSLDFDNIDELDRYLSEKYGEYKKLNWGDINGENDIA